MEDRRENDLNDQLWRRSVDEQLSEGRTLMRRLSDESTMNLRLTTELRDKLEEHRKQTAPMIEAVETMQAGVRVLGGIGIFASNVARAVGRVLKFIYAQMKGVAAVLGAIAAVWVAFKDEIIMLASKLEPLWQWIHFWRK